MADRKDIQRERVRGYFLQAAKDLIATEGLGELTTKKIGERAGFSYATIYNYFGNFNELACLAVEALTAETVAAALGEWDEPTPAAEDALTADTTALRRVLAFKDLLVERFAGNPNRYFPFLSTEIDFSYFEARDGHPYVHPAWTALHGELARHAPALGLDGPGTRQLADILSYVFHAKLHFFIRYGVPASVEDLQTELDSEVRFLFARLGTS